MLLKTERLFLRNLRPEDATVILSYRQDPECAKYQRWEAVTEEEIRIFCDRFRESRFLSDQPEQHYAICTRGGKLAGDLSYFYTEEDRCVTLGITIAPEFQRRGIAREMLSGVIAAIQERHPQLDIVALIDPDNRASLALFEGLGFYRECYADKIQSFVYVIDGKRNV